MTTLQQKYEAPVAIVAWDSARLERKSEYPAYKAQRRNKPQALRDLGLGLVAACEMEGLRIVLCEGWEADDVMASVVHEAYPLGVVVVSDDKDLLQVLVNQRVIVVRPYDDYSEWDEFRFFREWGILPERLPDYLALVGDQSDGVQGVAGIGATRGKWLLSRFPSLTHIFDAVNSERDAAEHERSIPGTLAKLLRGEERQAAALKTRALVTLNFGLNVGVGKESVR